MQQLLNILLVCSVFFAFECRVTVYLHKHTHLRTHAATVVCCFDDL